MPSLLTSLLENKLKILVRDMKDMYVIPKNPHNQLKKKVFRGAVQDIFKNSLCFQKKELGFCGEANLCQNEY